MIALVLFFISIYLLYSYYSKNRKISNYDPQRPVALPVLGNLHQLGRGKTPNRGLTELSKIYGDVFGFWMADTYTIVISDPDVIRELFIKNFDNFVDRTHFPSKKYLSFKYRSLASGDEPYWRVNKPLVVSAFSNLKIRQHTDVILNNGLKMIEIFKGFADRGEAFYPGRILQRFSLNIILGYIFSMEVPFEDKSAGEKVDRFLTDMQEMFRRSGSTSLMDHLKGISRIYEFYLFNFCGVRERNETYIRNLILEHISTFDPNSPRDLVDSLILELNDSTPEALDKILFITRDLVFAGTDTTSSTIQWFMIFMANNPSVQEKVYNDVKRAYDQKKLKPENLGKKDIHMSIEDRRETKYLSSTIKEVLRLKPAASLGLPRRAKDDIMINDYFIPKGTQIIHNVYAMQRHEKHWIRPDEFLPERFIDAEVNPALLPFSVGPRNCLGSFLAQDELYLATSNLILNFKFESSNSEPIDETEVFGLTICPKHFDIKLTKRFN